MPYVYNEYGYVSDWGPPTFHYYEVDATVSAWETFKVSIWLNRALSYWRESLFFYVERWSDIIDHYNNYFSTSGQSLFFYVDRWSDIIDHNNNCFSTSGETCGIAFVVDSFIWSELYGWEFGYGHSGAVADPSQDRGSDSERDSEATTIIGDRDFDLDFVEVHIISSSW